MKIIVDSSSLYSSLEGRKQKIKVLPVRVNFNGKSYKDYDDISTDEIISHIVQGAIPKSSQPAVGEVMQVFERTDDEILAFSIGDGLSGTYSNFVGAKNSTENNERIHVVDTKTLAGAYHYIVEKAIHLRDDGLNIQQIKDTLQDSINHCWSYVIPTNFTFLKRSGRLSPLAANAAMPPPSRAWRRRSPPLPPMSLYAHRSIPAPLTPWPCSPPPTHSSAMRQSFSGLRTISSA